MHRWLRTLLERAKPYWPDVERFVSVVNEFLRIGIGQRHVLHDISGSNPRGVKSAIQHASVAEVVQEPSRQRVEREAHVLKCRPPDPKPAPIVPKHVLCQG